MGIAKLYGQKASGTNINGIIKEYSAAENINIGDLVEIINGTDVRKTTTSQFDGVAKTRGVGGDETGHKDLVSIYTLPQHEYVEFTSSIFPTNWEAIEAPTKYIAVNEYGEWQIEGTNIMSNYPACNAFDTNTGNEIVFNTYNYSYVQISLPDGVKIKPSSLSVSHYITGASSYVQGYNDNSDEWENLGELKIDSEVTARTDYFSYTGDIFYSRFRVYKKSYNSNYPNPRLVEFAIRSGIVEIYG